MHSEAMEWIADHLDGDATRVLEFGSLDINGSPRVLVDETVTWVGVDLVAGAGVDIVDDAATVEVEPGTWDAVICAEVLEHVTPDVARAIVLNMVRHVRDGGQLIITAAGLGRAPHSAVDGGPLRPGEHYHPVSRSALSQWLADAGVFSALVDDTGVDVRAVAWV